MKNTSSILNDIILRKIKGSNDSPLGDMADKPWIYLYYNLYIPLKEETNNNIQNPITNGKYIF